MRTPWGRAEDPVELIPGVFGVSTASHGGYLIHKDVASQLLSEAAQRRGERFMEYLAYEEVIAYVIVLFEIPQLLSRVFNYRHFGSEKKYADYIFRKLSGWYADYLFEVGVTPEPDVFNDWMAYEEDREWVKPYHALVKESNKLGLPKRYHTDLYVTDRSKLRDEFPSNFSSFIWAVRELGTDLFPISADSKYDLERSLVWLEAISRDHYYIYEDEQLRPASFEQCKAFILATWPTETAARRDCVVRDGNLSVGGVA